MASITETIDQSDISELLSVPTSEANEQLRGEIEKAERKQEHLALKNKLNSIREDIGDQQGLNNPMRNSDKFKVLKSKRRGKPGFLDLLRERFVAMYDLRPITGAIIALSLLVVAFALMLHKMPNSWLVEYATYINWVLGLAAGYVVVKSAARSLMLPTLALIIGGTSRAVIPLHGTLFQLDAAFFTRMLIVGAIGVVIAAVSID